MPLRILRDMIFNYISLFQLSFSSFEMPNINQNRNGKVNPEESYIVKLYILERL